MHTRASDTFNQKYLSKPRRNRKTERENRFFGMRKKSDNDIYYQFF